MGLLSNTTTNFRAKLLLCSESGMGKTGSLAMLANAGWKLGVLDLEGNILSAANYTKEDKLENINVASFDPQSKDATTQIKNALLKGWDGWPPVKEWGPDHIIVLDTASTFGDACLKFAHNHPEVNKDERTLYKVAGKAYEEIVYSLTGPNLKCHFVCLTHLKYIESEGTKRRIFPAALGKAMPQEFGKRFTDVWRIDISKPPERKRIFRTSADGEMGLKSSNPLINAEEPFEDFARLWNLITRTTP